MIPVTRSDPRARVQPRLYFATTNPGGFHVPSPGGRIEGGVSLGGVESVRMALPAGMHLGPYEVLSPLGAGGMGEVYRATARPVQELMALPTVNSIPTASAAPALHGEKRLRRSTSPTRRAAPGASPA